MPSYVNVMPWISEGIKLLIDECHASDLRDYDAWYVTVMLYR